MKSLQRRIPLGGVAYVAVAALFAAGCADDDGGGRNRPVPTPTSTASHSPTPTPTEGGHHGPPHSIMRVGSTEEDAGALTVNEVPVAFVAESACLGGSGDHCEGGTVVYTGTSPGFEDLTADDPNQPIYVLSEGIEISLEIVAIDADASLMISAAVLDAVGEMVVVNTTGHLHNHPTWQIVAPGGDVPADKKISFRLHGEGFEDSEVITVTLRLFEEEEHDTPTPTATVTPTPEHHGPPHSLMRVGSTEHEGGSLTVNEVPPAFVAESACLGGSGDQCEGGTLVYTGTSPGFTDLTADDPNQPIYVLPEGIEVSIELTAVEAGASVLISGVVLDEVGETAVVNTTGHLHNHPTWMLVAPAGEVPADKQISFRLHAEGLGSSDAIPLILSLFDENEGGDSHAD